MIRINRLVFILSFAVALLTGDAGCSSIYNAAASTTPARTDARLSLRLREAEEQAHRAVKAIESLRGAKPAGRESAAARLEIEGWEVQRRALSIGDLIARITPPPPAAGAARGALQAAGRATVAAAQAAAKGPAEPELNAATRDLSNALALTQAARTEQAAHAP
ncbi:hypothetical protein PHYC_02070 [Phycisphaerales bacterium]|nr:hypothetical protein PHYC_02070 [Phycisphaerales bacterium]